MNRSGIEASDELLRETAKALQPGSNIRSLIFEIVVDKLRIDTICERNVSAVDDWQNYIYARGKTGEPFFFIFETDEPQATILGSFIPESAVIRQKMIYASSRQVVLKQLSAQILNDLNLKLDARHLEDICWQKIVNELQNAAKPQDNTKFPQEVDQIQSESLKKLRDCFFASSNVSNVNIGLKLSQGAKDALSNVQNSSQNLLVVLEIDLQSEQITLMRELTGKFEDIAEGLSSEPKFMVYRWILNDQPVFTFMYICSSSAQVKQKILYSTSCSQLQNSLHTDYNLEIDKRIEASDIKDLIYQFSDHVISKKAIPTETTTKPIQLKFSRPLGPPKNKLSA